MPKGCAVCGKSHFRPLYEGPCRWGGVGTSSSRPFKVRQCTACHYAFLSPLPNHLKKFYETDDYRKKYDCSTNPALIQIKYDHEQNERIKRIGVENVRGKIVMDLGAAAGLFLDCLRGLAAKTIAIEPTKSFHVHLEKSGHKFYNYAHEALRHKEKADIIVSFDVIEHIQNPREFISDAADLLKKNGRLFLSMPNLDDYLLKVVPQNFRQFFFQYAHVGYFSNVSVERLFRNKPFKKINIGYLHKYGIENLIQWCQAGRPGVYKADCFDWHFNENFRRELERLGLASHLFISAEKI
jgi:2-polyprenyl-3-methyl-5-hydroxy-6-metoxy-1,4-benzoquinol methylase